MRLGRIIAVCTGCVHHLLSTRTLFSKTNVPESEFSHRVHDFVEHTWTKHPEPDFRTEITLKCKQIECKPEDALHLLTIPALNRLDDKISDFDQIQDVDDTKDEGVMGLGPTDEEDEKEPVKKRRRLDSLNPVAELHDKLVKEQDLSPIWTIPTDSSEESITLLENLAENGNADAACLLAVWFVSRAIPKDSEKSLKYFIKGAELGNPFCQVQLGRIYLHGDSVKQDTQMGLHWLKIGVFLLLLHFTSR